MTTKTTSDIELGFFRRLFLPIYQKEMAKVCPMFLMYFCIVFNYNLLRAVKDSLLITAPQAGAVAIPFVKTWGVLPLAFLSTLFFARLSIRYSRAQVFYIVMTVFLIFFFVFGFILYPCHAVLHPHHFADILQNILPLGLKGLVSLVRNWTFAVFYIMSDLWGTLVMAIVFWTMVNEITSMGEATRFYAVFGTCANIATIFAGTFNLYLPRWIGRWTIGRQEDQWGIILMIITGLVVVFGLGTMGIFKWWGQIQKDEFCNNQLHQKLKYEKKETTSVYSSFGYVFRSPSLWFIAIMVSMYNISLSLLEVIWKNQLHRLFPCPADYNVYMGKVLICIGIFASIFSWFFCGPLIRKFGWIVGAYFTPVLLSIASFIFFLFFFFHAANISSSAFFGFSPLGLCVFFGSVVNIFLRASKFSFFDTTKEMAFIPLNKDSKLKGKAFIDGVCSKIGKSGGSLFYQSLLMLCGTLDMIAPMIAFAMVWVLIFWCRSVRSLGINHALQRVHE